MHILNIANLCVAVVVGAIMVWRELTPRVLNERPQPEYRLPLVALVALVPLITSSPGASQTSWLLVALTAVVGAGLGLARGFTLRMWRSPEIMRRGGGWTALLWLAGAGIVAGIWALAYRHDPASAQLNGYAAIVYVAATGLVSQWCLENRTVPTEARSDDPHVH